MNKELTPLQALDEIRLVHKDDNGLQRRADIIENAFRENSELRTRNYELLEESELFYNERNKYKKALKIIKEKMVNVGAFMKCCLSLSYEEYIKQWGNWHKHIFKNISGEVLTQEEYNLLKEVFDYE